MTNPTQPYPSVYRRRFLQLLAASEAAAAGEYLLYEYAPWLDFGKAVAFPKPLCCVRTPTHPTTANLWEAPPSNRCRPCRSSRGLRYISCSKLRVWKPCSSM